MRKGLLPILAFAGLMPIAAADGNEAVPNEAPAQLPVEPAAPVSEVAVQAAEAAGADIPGNSTTKATLPINQTVSGDFEFDDDADWYRVSLKAGTNYTFRAEVFADNDPDDDYNFGIVQLNNTAGKNLRTGFPDDYDGYIGGFDFRPQADGTLFLAVTGSAVGGYRIAFKIDPPAEPPTTATIAPGQRKTDDFFSSDDEDTWRIRLEKGRAYDFAVVESECFGKLQVLDERGRILADGRFLDEPPSNRIPNAFEGHVEDFLAPYTGTFHLRARCQELSIGPYAIVAAADRSVPNWNPASPPSKEDDLVVLKATADRVNALAGDDLVYGRDGNDGLEGGDGSDAVFGEGGADSIEGGPGSDFLYGGPGNDRIRDEIGLNYVWGDGGRDVIAFNRGPEATILVDFDVNNDKIDLTKIDANTDKAGDQAFTFIGTRELTSAGQLNYSYNVLADRTTLRGQINAEGHQLQIELLGKLKLSAGNFSL